MDQNRNLAEKLTKFITGDEVDRHPKELGINFSPGGSTSQKQQPQRHFDLEDDVSPRSGDRVDPWTACTTFTSVQDLFDHDRGERAHLF